MSIKVSMLVSISPQFHSIRKYFDMASIIEAIDKAKTSVGYSELKEYQQNTVQAYLSNRDVFVSAPTGAGKSLAFELAPYAFEHLLGNKKSMVLVVVPLVSLMKDQVNNLVSRGIPASYVGDDCSEDQLTDILNFKARIVFGSPEALLNSYRHIFRQLKSNLKAVFVDESHCIAKWGKDSVTEEAFRRDYGRLSELRSLVHRDIPVIALTATATEATQKTIIKDLCMKNCVEIIGDPNKPNIRYSVKDVDHENLYDTFRSIIDELEEMHVNATKVIVFCRRKEHAKELFELFTQCLGPKAYYRPTGKEPVDDRSRLFAMYHKKTHSL
ncbi:uncharacterized protein LOC114544901, partial [Dendronephthya gigantea]|uniref:uncharacterized protein LOC114544901 n=1 Tax=Dendronephthya gigantea TaxID=151771 RepID=UPI00106A36BB